MAREDMIYGTTYRVEVYRGDQKIATAKAYRVGFRHVETTVEVSSKEVHAEAFDALSVAKNALHFLTVKPRLGELISRSIWDMIDVEKDEEPPF